MEDRTDPAACDSCQKPFGKKRRGKKREFRRCAIDPITSKLLYMCNACSLRLMRAGWRKKKEPPAKVMQTEKDDYVKAAEEFSRALCEMFGDDTAIGLHCPAVTPRLCGCIQRHVGLDVGRWRQTGDDESLKTCREKATELLEICKMAKRLVKEKTPRPQTKDVPSNILKGVVNLRSKKYQEFVLSNRERLKREYKLCERGVQRLLCYSNNYLHKQLKSAPDQKARIVGKGATAEQLLPSVSSLADSRCCGRRCSRMALTHSKLVERWRERALSGQCGARAVLAEMLTPAGGSCNCPRFVHLVTGCSTGLLSKVRQELRLSAGLHEPPEHGLREYWRQKKIKAAMHRGPTKQSVKNSSASSASKENSQVQVAGQTASTSTADVQAEPAASQAAASSCGSSDQSIPEEDLMGEIDGLMVMNRTYIDCIRLADPVRPPGTGDGAGGAGVLQDSASGLAVADVGQLMAGEGEGLTESNRAVSAFEPAQPVRIIQIVQGDMQTALPGELQQQIVIVTPVLLPDSVFTSTS